MEVWADAKHRAKLGLRSQTKRFADVAQEFLDHTAQAVARGERNKSQAHNWALKVNRYLVEFFGDRDIDAIGQREITRYLEWRRNYWISGPGQNVEQITYQRGGRTVRRRVPPQLRRPPSPATQRHEAVAIKALFRQAAEWGYVQPSAIPHINVPRVIAKPRPSFEASEFTRLEAAALARLEEEFLHPSVRRDRLILYCYIKVAAFSGMRPTELKNLKWGDILDYRERRQLPLRDRDIRIRARGKAKSRTFVAMEVVLPVLDMLWSDWVRLHGGDRLLIALGYSDKQICSKAALREIAVGKTRGRKEALYRPDYALKVGLSLYGVCEGCLLEVAIRPRAQEEFPAGPV